MQDLRQVAGSDPSYPPILFFYQGSVAEGEAFFGKFWPEATAVSDMPQIFYRVFKIRRGGLKEMFGPEVWMCGVRASRKGNSIGAPIGDPWLMPGLFLVQGKFILWQHDFRHAGDHPDFREIRQIVQANLAHQE